ncbi:hypothetical protein WA026_014937, partial [Henosepilachna vigintioctopunctata]
MSDMEVGKVSLTIQKDKRNKNQVSAETVSVDHADTTSVYPITLEVQMQGYKSILDEPQHAQLQSHIFRVKGSTEAAIRHLPFKISDN